MEQSYKSPFSIAILSYKRVFKNSQTFSHGSHTKAMSCGCTSLVHGPHHAVRLLREDDDFWDRQIGIGRKTHNLYIEYTCTYYVCIYIYICVHTYNTYNIYDIYIYICTYTYAMYIYMYIYICVCSYAYGCKHENTYVHNVASA